MLGRLNPPVLPAPSPPRSDRSIRAGAASRSASRSAFARAPAPPIPPEARSAAPRRRELAPAAPVVDDPASSGDAPAPPVGASRRSFSLSSRKYGCRRAWRADRRSSGLYARSLLISSMHSGDVCGSSLAMPDPSRGGKLKSMCCDRRLSLARYSAGGVPRTLWIFWIWSSSFVPGKRG